MEPLSINRNNANDSMQEAAAPLTIDKEQYACFARSGALTLRHNNLFTKSQFIAAIREMHLQAPESLLFAGDSISVYLDHPSLSRVTKAIESLIDLAESISEPTEELDLSALPTQFHPLIPLIKKWAIGDDSDREDFLEDLPKTTLKRFVEEVEPYLPLIDSYLDSFGSHPSEEACALGRLAECAVEAKHLLASKS
jgi:hypothetical protein